MAYQFTENPTQGLVDILPNGRKFQFNAGKWDLYTSTLPQNVSPVINATPPIEAAVAPALPNANMYWFDTANGIMHYQYDGAWVAMASGTGGSSTPVPPIVAESAPALPNTNPLWFNPAEGVLYVQKVVGEVRSWERCVPEVVIPAPTAVAPLESESPPVLPNGNPFWFKPSTSVLHYQYNDGNSTQWVEI